MMYLARRLYLTFTATSSWVAEVTGEYIPFVPLPAYRLPSRLPKLTLSLKTSSAMTDTAWTFHTSIVVDHYHQRRPVPYRRYASTLTYGRALMGRASRENISCRGLRWDIFPLRSDYGSTSMAWVGLLKWAIYMWHSLLQV